MDFRNKLVFVPDKPFQPNLEDKHSSLLRKSINYGHKKFYSTGPSLVGLSLSLCKHSLSLSLSLCKYALSM